ncbi:glycosyltransferase [Providencia sp. PROV150]|uniref:glycosyltransferase n=1 Tax=Providencia sp. PROV150 TaxID=2949860 RepID=UPI0023497674|nr:glycosyltransferase [Providencia sp. PROV150]
MKKITFIITKSEIGGAQAWILELKKLLTPYYKCTLITSDYGWLTDQFEPNDIAIIPEINSFINFKASFKIAKRLKANSTDIVISSSANAGIHSRLSKLMYNHKHIYVSHGWSCIYNGGKLSFIFCNIERLFSLITDTILCVSNKDYNNAINKLKISKRKLLTIQNKISPMPEKKLINQKLKVLFVGRLAPPKRADLFIDTAEYFPNIDFYVVGSGPLKTSLIKQQENIANITMLGEISNFRDYNDFDIFVLCSESEGLPMSALEAGSAGLPLLLSSVGGCGELIYQTGTNANGLLFDNNLSSLKENLAKIINNYNEYYQAAQNSKELFDISSSIEHYLNLVKE